MIYWANQLAYRGKSGVAVKRPYLENKGEKGALKLNKEREAMRIRTCAPLKKSPNCTGPHP
jgi:hypothetical protein